MFVEALGSCGEIGRPVLSTSEARTIATSCPSATNLEPVPVSGDGASSVSAIPANPSGVNTLWVAIRSPLASRASAVRFPAAYPTEGKSAIPKNSISAGPPTALPLRCSCTAAALLYTWIDRVLLPAGGATQLSTMWQVKGRAAAEGQSTGRPASAALMFDSHQARNHQASGFRNPTRSASMPVAVALAPLLWPSTS